MLKTINTKSARSLILCMVAMLALAGSAADSSITKPATGR